MRLKNIGVSLAAVTTLSTGVVMTTAPARALSLSGTLNLQGAATVPDYTTLGQTQNIVFQQPTLVTGSLNGDAISAAGITINNLALKLLTQTTAASGVVNRTFSNVGLTPFINFGSRTIDATTANLTFNLLPSDDYTGSKTNSGLLSLFTGGPLLGSFQFNGTTIASGTVSASRSGTVAEDGIYGITLTAQPVAIPTPALLPGLLALGAGMLRKQKNESAEASRVEA